MRRVACFDQQSQMRDRHVDREGHRRDVARGLREEVAALHRGDEAGGERRDIQFLGKDALRLEAAERLERARP